MPARVELYDPGRIKVLAFGDCLTEGLGSPGMYERAYASTCLADYKSTRHNTYISSA